MKQVLRILAAQKHTSDWMELLTIVEIAINYAHLATTEYSPFYLHYGYHPIFQWDLADTVQAVQTEPL